jgi:hypothetical protein
MKARIETVDDLIISEKGKETHYKIPLATTHLGSTCRSTMRDPETGRLVYLRGLEQVIQYYKRHCKREVH